MCCIEVSSLFVDIDNSEVSVIVENSVNNKLSSLLIQIEDLEISDIGCSVFVDSDNSEVFNTVENSDNNEISG